MSRFPNPSATRCSRSSSRLVNRFALGIHHTQRGCLRQSIHDEFQLLCLSPNPTFVHAEDALAKPLTKCDSERAKTPRAPARNASTSSLLVGSYPLDRKEIEELRSAGFTAILSLQTDEDLGERGIEWERKAALAANLTFRSLPVRDFDAADLQEKLPSCVVLLDTMLQAGHTVYVHCTAGQGRSPTVAAAYLHWCLAWPLERALAARRPRLLSQCGSHPLRTMAAVRTSGLRPGVNISSRIAQALGDHFKSGSSALLVKAVHFCPPRCTAQARSSRVQHANSQQVEFGSPVHLTFDQLQSANVAFHRPRAPGQGECSPYRCLIALQLYREVMERRWVGHLAPWEPRRHIAFPHHPIELFSRFHGSSDLGGKSAEGLCEALLGWGCIVGEAEQERAGLPWTGRFCGGEWAIREGRPRTPRRTRNQRRRVAAAKSAPWA